MESVNRLGPELILLAAAGLIVLADVAFLVSGERARTIKRLGLLALALAGAAGSIAWSAALIAADEEGEAFSGTMSVDKFALFFNFLFAGIAAIVVLASVDFLRTRGQPARLASYSERMLAAARALDIPLAPL